MVVMVAIPFVLWTPHFETDLEIIQRHLDAGDDVILLVCNADLQVCDANLAHGFKDCMRCIGKRKAGYRQLTGRLQEMALVDLNAVDRNEVLGFQRSFESTAELKAVQVDNFDIGWATLSSLVSATRDPEPDLTSSSNAKLLDGLLASSLAVYRSVRNHLRRTRVDKVYVFNGRFANVRAVFRACQAESIPCTTHDRGCDFDHYSLYENVTPLDLQYYQRMLLAAWEAADPARRETVGAAFFEERADGKMQSWYSFVANQEPGLLPSQWNPEMRNIAIFTSSEDEFAALGDEWKNPLYENQLDGIRRIVGACQLLANVRVFVRVHPNLRNVSNSTVRAIRDIAAPNLTLIPPESPVGSYALMRESDRVISFGSTAGIEAVYWGTPSVLAGISAYRGLCATYNPESHEELMHYVAMETLPKKDKTGALQYGYFEMTRGERFRYFKGSDVFDGLFKGNRLYPVRPYGSLSARIGGGPFRGLADRGIAAWSKWRTGA